jgi:hypothetical protein
VVLYLDEGFEGGRTRFFEAQTSARATLEIRPSAGGAAIFPHEIWHEGETVERGIKHVLRSDLVYRPLEAAEDAPRGHDGYVWCVLPLADGTIFSGGRDGLICAWANGRVLSRTRAAQGSVLGLVERDDGVIASVTRAGVLSLWTRRGGNLERSFEGPIDDGALLGLVALPGARLAMGTTRGEVVWVDPRGAVLERRPAHEGWVWGVAADQAGAVASVGEDGALRIHHDSGSTELGRAPRPLRAVCAERAKNTWITGDSGGWIERWSGGATEGLGRCGGAITSLAVDSQGRIASGDEAGAAVIRGARETRWLHQDFVRCVRWERDGALATASYDGSVRSLRS